MTLKTTLVSLGRAVKNSQLSKDAVCKAMLLLRGAPCAYIQAKYRYFGDGLASSIDKEIEGQK